MSNAHTFAGSRVHSILSVLCFFILTAPAAAERRLSLSQAVALGMKQNPALKLEEAKILEAVANRKSTRGLYGPKLLADANIMIWDSSLPFEIETPPPEEINLTPIEQEMMMKFMSLFQIGDIRDQVTGQIQLTVAQPLTPLLQIYQGHQATSHLEQAANLDQQGKRAAVTFQIKQRYLQMMQAMRFREIAQTGLTQVQHHLKKARQFHTAGLIGKQDVLKVQLEEARAKNRIFAASHGVSLAGSGLALALGLSVMEEIIPTEEVQDPPPPFPLDLVTCLRRSNENRPELKSISRKKLAAEANQKRTKWDMVPQISAIANYQHVEGQGLMPKDSFFFGGMLKWDIWDWGHKYYKTRAAGAQVVQAELGRRLMRDGIAIQAKKGFLDLKKAEADLEVARTAISEAKENFRIEKTRFEANANTTSDVLDAQLALSRAELTYITSLYGYYIARAALERAIGGRIK